MHSLMRISNAVFSCHPPALKALYQTIEKAIGAAESTVAVSLGTTPSVLISGDTATVPVRGYLFDKTDELLNYLGITNTGYKQIIEGINEALGNRRVQNIVLDVDSPGGYVDAGLYHAADAIYGARETKNITASVRNMAASAAYWLASQAGSIEAERNATIGSIGVYSVVRDYSAAYEDYGIKTYVISSGKDKGQFVPGNEIPDSALAIEQQLIDDLAEQFFAAVERGRNMDGETVRKLGTGAYWSAGRSAQFGLIDSVIGQHTGTASENRAEQTKGSAMEDEPTTAAAPVQEPEAATEPTNEEPEAATEAEATIDPVEAAKAALVEGLKAMEAAFPQHGAFARDCWEKGLTIEQATVLHYEIVCAELASLRDENAQLKEALASASYADAGGSDPVATGVASATGSDPFMEACRAYSEEHKCSLTDAMRFVRKHNPGLLDASISEWSKHSVPVRK